MNDFNKQLVFVVGSGRSGTTLLRNILDFHNEVAVVPELHFFDVILSQKKLYKNLNNLHNKEKLINDIIKTINFSGDPYYRQKHFDYDLLRSKLFLCDSYKSLFIELSLFLSSKKCFNVLIEKTPIDVFFIDQIFKYFPKAKLIHILRDGREFCASSHKRRWGNIYNLMALWRESIRAVRIAQRRYIGKNNDIFEIKYEDLVKNTKDSISELFSFLGIKDVDDGFTDQVGKLQSFSSFFSGKKGVYQSEHFTQYFSLNSQKMINCLLKKDLANLGYPAENEGFFILDKIHLFLETLKLRINFWSRRIGYYHLYKKLKKYLL